jgi:hypothetical protein
MRVSGWRVRQSASASIAGVETHVQGFVVERATRFTILLHLPNDHTAESVAAAMIEAIYGQQGLLRRLTIDTTRRYQSTGIPPGRRR